MSPSDAGARRRRREQAEAKIQKLTARGWPRSGLDPQGYVELEATLTRYIVDQFDNVDEASRAEVIHDSIVIFLEGRLSPGGHADRRSLISVVDDVVLDRGQPTSSNGRQRNTRSDDEVAALLIGEHVRPKHFAAVIRKLLRELQLVDLKIATEFLNLSQALGRIPTAGEVRRSLQGKMDKNDPALSEHDVQSAMLRLSHLLPRKPRARRP